MAFCMGNTERQDRDRTGQWHDRENELGEVQRGDNSGLGFYRSPLVPRQKRGGEKATRRTAASKRRRANIAIISLSLALLATCLWSIIEIGNLRAEKDRIAGSLSWLAFEHAKVRTAKDEAIAKLQPLPFLEFYEVAGASQFKEFDAVIRAAWEYGQKYVINPRLVLAIIHRESFFDQFAKSSVAHGYMQVNFKVWRDELKIDEARLYDPFYNIELGCRILRGYYEETGDWNTALLLYNNGYNIRNWKYPERVLSSKFMEVRQ